MEKSLAKSPPHKILYLDDNVETCTLVKINLERTGVLVDILYSPEDINISKLDEYSLIITDYRLSGPRNGLDVIREFRKHGTNSDYILVTGFGDESVLTEALRTGVIDFVSKNHIFFENLVHVVSRVLELRKKEEEILTEKLRTKAFSLLGEILESAQIDHWIFNERNSNENRFPVQFFKRLGIELREFSGFWQNVPSTQRFRLFRELERAKRAKKSFEVLISFSSSTSLWFRIRGVFDPKVEGRSYGIVLDETNSVLNEKRLAETLQQREEISKRLQLSVVEIHHRVKNSFQMMISLLNMQLRGKETLDRDAVNNISSHLYGLSTIHDLLTARAGSHSLEEINIQELLDKLISNLPLNSSERVKIECENITVSPRVASTFAVVANELLMNAIKHGAGPIEISCEVMEETHCKVCFTNLIEKEVSSDHFEKSRHGAGISLVKFLSKADLKQEAKWLIDGTKVSTEFILPVLSGACTA